MKLPFLSLASLLLAGLSGAVAQSPSASTRDDSAAEKLGWHLANKEYTFRNLTLFETIDITRSLGLKYFELNPTLKVSKENPATIDPNLSPEARTAIKKKFADAGVQVVGFGVVKLTKDEAADRKTFQLAKDLGIQILVSEPEAGSFDILDKLCDEFQISIAIHNHPSPSPYWKPDLVLAAIQGHNKRIGACADVGHWTRSGLNAVECLHQLAGHIVSLHFKDVDDNKKDVPWGQGKTDVHGMLTELHRQKFQGLFSMEYEGSTGDTLIADLKKSIAVFDSEAKKLAAAP